MNDTTTLLLLATSNGLVVCELLSGEWREVRRGLTGELVTSVIAREGVILAGTRRGVFRSDDLGRSWQPASTGLETQIIRWLAYHPDTSDFEFAGTEPAGIFISHNGAETWRACGEVAHLRQEHGWFLPYSPEAGCVRGLAFQGRRAYAAVEVGGVLCSEDSGETWRLAAGSSGNPADMSGPAQGFVHPDVHSIDVHPSSPDLVYAPTGGGFYRSRDGGVAWECVYDCYCRAAWIDPLDPERIILGPADGVDHNGRIEITQDGGRSWQTASRGLETPWRRHMVERFYQASDELLAVLSNGELLSASLANLGWRRTLPEAGGIHAVTTLSVRLIED